MRHLGIAALWGVLAILSSAPLWLTLPEPDALTLTEAIRLDPNGATPVTLPMTGEAASQKRFRLTFPFANDNTPLYLFIPTVSQQLSVAVNGRPIGRADTRVSMVGMASGTPVLLALPTHRLHPGANTLELTVRSLDLLPLGLSRVYVGDYEELASAYRLRVFLYEYLRFMVLAGQILITLVVAVIWLYRPAEALFGWMFLLLLMSMAIYSGMVWELIPRPMTVMPYMILAGSSASFVLVITVLLIAGQAPPRWLKWAVLVVPITCVFVAAIGLIPVMRLVLLVSVPLHVVTLTVAAMIAIWGALARRIEEAWLLLLPMLLMAITGVHDLAVLLGKGDSPVVLSIYYRPMVLIGIAMILMRRLGISLTRLDNVNAYLSQRLGERERELALLHERERNKAAQRALSEERARLTADLHDGLSGHLASIIALSEREQSKQVEHAAREALDDLRLVVQSLDIDDRELPVALAGLRERLERQLKRVGIRLEWSMARLPEVVGVTPSHALNVLRILQEAVSNAVQHGRATRIAIVGEPREDGCAGIVVENDGRPFPRHPPRGGNGLNNMRRRMRQLNGEVHIQPLEHGTRLTLLLPPRLPDVSDDRKPLADRSQEEPASASKPDPTGAVRPAGRAWMEKPGG